MRDLIIIGGGAAGLSAAMYALGKQLDVLLMAPSIGGKADATRYGVSTLPAPEDPGQAAVHLFAERLLSSGERVLLDAVRSISRSEQGFVVETANHGPEETLALIIATGVTATPLEVPGASGMLGYGLGYSATTRAPQMAGKNVAVIGSTQRAIRGVHELSQTARHVYFVADNMAGLMSPMGVAVQYRPGVELLEGYHVVKVLGNGHVEGLVIERAGQQQQIAVDAAFVDLGLRPSSGLVANLAQTDLGGFIRVDETGATSQPGLFAAGDVTTAFGEQLLIAIGQGAQAAVSAYDYLLARPSLREHAVV